MIVSNDTISISTESWFIPTDILMVSCSSIAVLLSLFSLFIIIVDKTCHTVPMLLIANTCILDLIFGVDMVASSLFTLQNDLKQIYYQDSLCITRGIIGYITVFLQNYSFLCQAIYRYIRVIYSNQIYYQSMKFQSLVVFLQYILGFIYVIPVITIGNVHYHEYNQICQTSLNLSFIMIYNLLCIFAIPSSITIFIYYHLVRYVKQINRNSTAANQLNRAKQELTMLRRVVILNMGVTCINLPYATMVFIGYITTPPKYHFRIAYIGLDVSLAFIMLAVFKFTDQFQNFIKKTIFPLRRSNRIMPSMT